MALATTYLSRLSDVHGRLRPRTYLEIGVCTGRALALAREDTLAYGVDPDPQLTTTLATSTRLFRGTSDRFFADGTAARDLEETPLDLVFIDGLHLFEAALLDFANSARRCAKGARILLHDTLPHDAQMARRVRETQAWTGDVWKIGLALRRACPYLEITTLDTAPTGLTFVGNIDAFDTTLLDHFDEIVAEHAGLTHADYDRRGRAALNVVPDERFELERLVPAHA
jgi:hypothetical protein